MILKEKIKDILIVINEYFLIRFCISLFIISIIILAFGLRVSPLDNSIILYSGLIFGFLAFFLWFKNLDEDGNKTKKVAEYFSLFFLIGLILISVFNLKILFKLTLTHDLSSILTLITIFSGVVIFYTNRKKISQSTEDEQIKEQAFNNQQNIKFINNFSRINKIPILGPAIKWIHNEGRWNISILSIIILLGFILRIWNLNYLQGSDNYNLLSAKSLWENGHFIYTRNLDITYILSILFKFFGATWTVARIPFITIGTISILSIYILGKYFNSKVAFIGAFLFAISPVSIEMSSFVREYAGILLFGNIFFIILISIHQKFKYEPKRFLSYYLLTFTLSTIIILFYSTISQTGTIKAILSILLVETLIILYYFFKNNYFVFLKYYLLASIIFITVFIKIIHVFITLFAQDLSYNPYWFKMFFDPMVSSPMQWFSFSTISWMLLFFIFSIGFLINFKKDIFRIFYLVFFLNVLLFVFKFNGWEYQHDRYLYHLFPFYTVIFSVGLYYLYLLSTHLKYPLFSKLVILLFLISSVIILPNTLHGANHDLTIWGAITNTKGRQPTAGGNRNYFLNIFHYLDSKGFNNKTPVIIQGEDPFFLTWYYNYPVTRSYYDNNYETGDKVFSVKKYSGIDEFKLATDLYKFGYFLTPASVEYSEKDFNYNKNIFTFQNKIEGYNIYIWTREE